MSRRTGDVPPDLEASVDHMSAKLRTTGRRLLGGCGVELGEGEGSSPSDRRPVGVLSTGERAEPVESRGRPMHDLPPYDEAKDYIRVRALVHRTRVDGVVLGWRTNGST